MYNQQEEINKEKLLKDRQFIKDAAAFLVDRGGYQSKDLTSAEDVYDSYMEHFRFQNVNEVTAINDMIYAQNTDEKGKERMARLMDAYDKMDSDLGFDAAGDYVAGVLSAPSTYAGIFTGGGAKVGALAAQQGIKLGIREALKGNIARRTFRNSMNLGAALTEKTARGKLLRQAATKGAVRAGAVETAIGAGQVAAQEQARVETDMQDEIRGSSVALGALAGAVPGAVFGSASQIQKAITRNKADEIVLKNVEKAKETMIRANNTVVRETFEDESTREIANDLLGLLKDARKLSLSETIPETLERGESLKKGLAPDDVEIVDVKGKPKMPLDAELDFRLFQNISAAAATLLKDTPPIVKYVDGKPQVERVTSRMVRALQAQGRASNEALEALVSQHGITVQDLFSLFGADVSLAGKKLGTQSGVARAEMAAIQKSLDDLDKTVSGLDDILALPRRQMEQAEKIVGRNPASKIYDVIKNLNKARIGMMTIQLATTTRNVTNGYMRNYVYAFDNLGAGLYNKAFAKNIAKKRFKKAGFEPTEEQLKDEAERAVRLGSAQLKIGFDSLRAKDLLSLTTAETTALAQLMRNPMFGKNEQAQRLFMDMADVADHAGANSKAINLARRLNTLNTMSDNMFKRAILSRELDKALIAGGVDGGLNQIIKEGRFYSINDKTMARAMDEALDFTYQTGNFKGREGSFNTGAQYFIDIAQTPLASTFVPFPRYMVNQFRFLYEHAPILGMFNVGGILNRTGKEGTKDFISMDADTFGKQVGGLAALSGLFAIRSIYGDDTTGPFEYKDPAGAGLVDAQAALGPFSAHAWLADVIYKNRGNLLRGVGIDTDAPTDSIKTATLEDFTKAIGGGQFRGTGLGIIDGAFDEWQRTHSATGGSDLVATEAVVKYLANVFNTFTVGAGVLKDIAATVDPEYRVVADNSDVSMMKYFFKQATRSFPRKVTGEESTFLGREKLGSPTREGGLRIMNPFMRQLTGLTPQETRNLAEVEFDRLGLEWAEVSPRKIKFDAPLSNIQRGMAGQFVEKHIVDYINSDENYRGAPDIVKKSLIKAQLREAREIVRSRIFDTDAYAGSVENQQRIARAIFFNKIKKSDQDIIGYLYKTRTGKSLDDTKDYLAALQIGEDEQIFKGGN